MIYTDNAIVLLRADFREMDRMLSLYTLDHGRINVRVPGVAKTAGKLKALSEPLVHATYRIYVRTGGAVGTVTGGKIQTVFPQVRTHLKRITMALHFCELIHRLTPLHQPSPEKYELLLKSLTEVELGEVNPAFSPAFTLRLMRVAGFGLERPVLQISNSFWEQMHEAPLSSLQFTEPEDLLSLAKCNNVCERFLNQYLTYPLNSTKPLGLQEDHPWAPLVSAPPQPATEIADLVPAEAQ